MKSSAPLSTASRPSLVYYYRPSSVRPNVHPSLAHHGEHRRLVLGLHLWVRHRRPVPVARAVFLRSRVRVTLGRLLTRVARRAHRERHRGPDRDSHVARSQSVSRPVPPGGDLDVDVSRRGAVGRSMRSVGRTTRCDDGRSSAIHARRKKPTSREPQRVVILFRRRREGDDERATDERAAARAAPMLCVHHTIVSFLTLYKKVSDIQSPTHPT
jgi:hypothetical protein